MTLDLSKMISIVSLLCFVYMMIILWLLLGLVGAVALIAVARIKPEKESQILAIGLILAALVYVGFAMVSDASVSWIVTEIVGVGIYSLFAVLGLRYSKWWLMFGWMAHPLWDIWLHFARSDVVFPPAWYAVACTSFDLLVAAYIYGVQVGLINLKISDYRG